MEPDISLLGNAAAVPIIIALTQFLKKNFNFKRKADVISLLVSVAVCVGWEFYHTPEANLAVVWGATVIAKLKHAMELLIVSGATWLSASKSYDLFVGDKKRALAVSEIENERESLRKELESLKVVPTDVEEPAPTPEPVEEDVDMDAKLRDILEGQR